MKKVILLFVFCFSMSYSFSQGWEKKYVIGPGIGYSNGSLSNIVPSMSGGYIASGTFSGTLFSGDSRFFLMKVNDSGDTLWTKTYYFPPPSVYTLSDQIVLGSVIELPDSSVMAIGYHIADSLSYYYSETDIKIVLDKNGNELPATSFTIDSAYYISYYFLENRYTNGYITGGRDTSATYFYNSFPSIKKYNDSGVLQWKHTNTLSYPVDGVLQSITPTSDSGIVAVYGYGSSPPSGEYRHMYKLDKNGTMLWDRNCADQIYHVFATDHNTTVMCYSWGWSGGGPYNHYISEFNSSGDSISGFQLGYEPLKVAENQYGGYTVMGYIQDGSSGYLRSFLVAYDSLWNVIWQQFDDNSYKIYSGSGLNWSPLLKTSDNGYVFGGYYNDFMSGGVSPWIFRTDSLGNTYKNNISGRISEDDNSDCIFNGSDHGYKNILVQANNGLATYYSFSHPDGGYSIRLDSGNYSVSHIPKMYRTPVCPSAAYSANLASGTDTISNLDFFDHLTSPFTDGAIYITPATMSVPGNNYTVYLNYVNIGTDTISGTISFTYDSVLTMIGSSIAPVSTVGNTLTFNYNNISEDSSGCITVNFTVDTTATLGDTLYCYGSITTSVTDVDTVDNFYEFGSIIVSSFDPNDKQVSPKGTGPQGYIAGTENLEYTIRFQNTGTYKAQNIVVRDTIPNNLNMSSFHFLSGSAPCTVSVVDQRTLYFTFQNINLPDSTSNEPASHGFLKYSIKPNSGLAPGAKIRNTAYIYFDFNSPIITNTTQNTIAFPASIDERESKNGMVNVYPNPFSDNTTFVIQSDKLNETYSFELTDVLGKKVRSITGISEKQFQISRIGLENGIYFYKIYSSGSNIGVGKLIIE